MINENPLSAFDGELRGNPPQRYLIHHSKYLARGGHPFLADDLAGFLAGGENGGDLARFYFFSLAYDQIVKEDLGGDFAELGVYKGNTATLLASYARRRGKTAYLLDTFEGFSSEDLVGIDAGTKAHAFNDTSLEAVRELVGQDNTKFIKGFFPQTADQLPSDGKYCFVHIDCDLYAPAKRAMEYFYPRLVPGGFLIVHDYSSLCWDGAEKAVDEFFVDKPECPLPLPDCAGSVAIRKIRIPDQEDRWIDRKRRKALSTEWTSAAHGGLSELLGSGWSVAESWGVWGVGEMHVMHLAPEFGRARDLEIELDVEAVVCPSRNEQLVEVAVNGQDLAVWIFNQNQNRDIRILRMPAYLTSTGSVTIEFRPKSIRSVFELIPGHADERCLGLGLHRIRIRNER